MVGGFDLAGVAEEWDNTFELRERVRVYKHIVLKRSSEKSALEVGFVQKTIPNLKANAMVLLPALQIMSRNNKKIPGIDEVLQEVQKLSELCGMEWTNNQMYEEAWAIRRLLTFVKSLTYKKSMPKETI